MREISYAQASIKAIQEEFRRDKKAVYMSTSISPELMEEFGPQRMRITPISESVSAGAAIGLAASGFRPIVDIGLAAFGFVAMDQIVNHAAKVTYMFGGQAQFPILYRMKVGMGRSMAAQHSVSPYSMYMNVPGLKIILSSTPYDVKGLLKTAIRENNPVISFEHIALDQVVGSVPDEEYTIPFGKAEIKKIGTDITVVALANMVNEAMAAAEDLEKQGISLEIIDPRTLVPLDDQTIMDSVAKTGGLVVIDEACQTCSAASEIVSLIAEDGHSFSSLKYPLMRICSLSVPVPYSPSMEKYVAPNKERIIADVRKLMSSRYKSY